MKRRKTNTIANLPVMMAELTFNSWLTILRRTQLIAEGKCTPAEYRRMVMEKAGAASASVRAMTTPGMPDPGAVLNPWLIRAKANAKRLRRG